MAFIKFLIPQIIEVDCKMDFFTLECALLPSQAYFLSQGFYEFDYATYLSIKFSPLNNNLFFGSDFNGLNQANVILESVNYLFCYVD